MLVLIALGVVAVGFTFYCLVDLARAKKVRSLSSGVWAVICLAVVLRALALARTVGVGGTPRLT
jgi:hypothetical protein